MLLDLKNSLDQHKAKAYLDKLIANGDQVELRKITKQRTLNQNSFLHACLAIFCNETGYSIDESKQFFSQLLPDLMMYEKNEFRFRRSTTTLDTKEMSVLIEKIRSFCYEELGIYLPNSEEYLINKFQIEKENQYVR